MVRVAQERVRIGGRAVGDRDADARSDAHRVASDRERVLECREQSVRDLGRLARRHDRADDDELVAVESSDRVAGTQRVGEAKAGGDEHVVAAGVPVGLVDAAEAIEVAEEHCRPRRRRSPRAPEPGAQLLGERDAVRQASERITARPRGEGVLHSGPVGLTPPAQRERDPGGDGEHSHTDGRSAAHADPERISLPTDVHEDRSHADAGHDRSHEVRGHPRARRRTLLGRSHRPGRGALIAWIRHFGLTARPPAMRTYRRGCDRT